MGVVSLWVGELVSMQTYGLLSFLFTRFTRFTRSTKYSRPTRLTSFNRQPRLTTYYLLLTPHSLLLTPYSSPHPFFKQNPYQALTR